MSRRAVDARRPVNAWESSEDGVVTAKPEAARPSARAASGCWRSVVSPSQCHTLATWSGCASVHAGSVAALDCAGQITHELLKGPLEPRRRQSGLRADFLRLGSR